jgi:hypothetical protein
MHWKVIRENERKFADTSYYLYAERTCPEGRLVLEISWVERFMYTITVMRYDKESGRKLWFKKSTKPQLVYTSAVFYEDRIEKYGHQLMRMTEMSPLEALKRLNSLQKDGVLNYNLSRKSGVDIRTKLPANDSK